MKTRNTTPKLIAMPMLLLSIALALMTVRSAAVTDVPTFSLTVGEHKFWDGEYVDTSTGDGCDHCEWKLVTSDGAKRLKVALDLPLDYRNDRTKDEGVHPDASAGRAFKLQILDENGNEVLANTTQGTGYSIELFLCFNKQPGEPCEPFQFDNGMPCGQAADGTLLFRCEGQEGFSKAVPRSSGGTWTIRVSSDGDILGWKFRMRAKLEGAAPASQNTPQLPNLRATPPFELTFCEPLVSAGFFAGNTPVCGSNSNGLTDGEAADLVATDGYKPRRGLRFSAGPENVGDGFLEIRTHPDDPRNTLTTRVAFQRVYYPDGTPVVPDREVGTMEFHQSHGHWHYQFFVYELFEVDVTQPTKPWKKIKLGQRIVGNKVGFCPSDERLADWNRFYQLRRARWANDRTEEDPVEGGISCLSPDRPMMGLTPGWGDLYEWARVEQFVEFPINADGSPRDGYYLLRATVDSTLNGVGRLVESNEDDNTSYVFFKVTNGVIEIIKRDYGLEP